MKDNTQTDQSKQRHIMLHVHDRHQNYRTNTAFKYFWYIYYSSAFNFNSGTLGLRGNHQLISSKINSKNYLYPL